MLFNCRSAGLLCALERLDRCAARQTDLPISLKCSIFAIATANNYKQLLYLFFKMILSILWTQWIIFGMLKFSLFLCLQRTPISHKVIEKRRRDRINRCLNELGKTVPMALAKQVFWSSNVCLALRDSLCCSSIMFYAKFHSSHLNTIQSLEQIVNND